MRAAGLAMSRDRLDRFCQGIERTVVTEAEVVAAPPTRGPDKVALHVHKRDVGFRRAPIDGQHRLIRKHP